MAQRWMRLGLKRQQQERSSKLRARNDTFPDDRLTLEMALREKSAMR